MRVIIAGCREIDDCAAVAAAIEDCRVDITTVLSGGCRGVDKLGEQWAAAHGVPVEIYPAQWKIYGRAAGMRRSAEMVARADALIAITSRRFKGRGTAATVEMAIKKGLQVYVRELS